MTAACSEAALSEGASGLGPSLRPRELATRTSNRSMRGLVNLGGGLCPDVAASSPSIYRPPRPISRATSTLALKSASHAPLSLKPAACTGTTGVPLPKSRLPIAAKSTANLRSRPSHNSLRPSRLIQPSFSGLRPPSGPTPQIARPTIRRIPSTNFKENYFAPPPTAPIPHAKTERKGLGLVKRKSQLLPTRRVVPGQPATGRELLGGKREVTDGSRQSSGPLRSAPQPLGPVINRRAPTPSPLPPLAPTSTTYRTPHRKSTLPLQTLHPSPSIPSNLGSSPWKGPRTSIDQIKDTEYSFTEDDSLEIPSVAVSRFDPDGSGETSRWLSVSTLSRSPSRMGVALPPLLPLPDTAVEALKAKEREIETLHKELSLERQMLGRLRREEAERNEESNRITEVERAEMARRVMALERERAVDKCRAVVRAAAEMQADIDGAREMIRKLREVL